MVYIKTASETGCHTVEMYAPPHRDHTFVHIH